MLKGIYKISKVNGIHGIWWEEGDSMYRMSFDPDKSELNGAKEGDEVEFIHYGLIQVKRVVGKDKNEFK